MAGSLNKVMLIGRLGRDPELRYTQGGSPVANFTMATDEYFSDQQGNRQERTEWHRIVVFGKQAEMVSNYLSKGRLVFVEGSIRTSKWQDKQGQDKYTTEIIAVRVQFLDSKGQGATQAPQAGGQRYNQQSGPQGQQGDQASQAQEPEEDYGPVFPSEASGMDEVPF